MKISHLCSPKFHPIFTIFALNLWWIQDEDTNLFFTIISLKALWNQDVYICWNYVECIIVHFTFVSMKEYWKYVTYFQVSFQGEFKLLVIDNILKLGWGYHMYSQTSMHWNYPEDNPNNFKYYFTMDSLKGYWKYAEYMLVIMELFSMSLHNSCTMVLHTKTLKLYWNYWFWMKVCWKYLP